MGSINSVCLSVNFSFSPQQHEAIDSSAGNNAHNGSFIEKAFRACVLMLLCKSVWSGVFIYAAAAVVFGGRYPSACSRLMAIPTPSMSARNTPPNSAERADARAPERAASMPPEIAPLAIEFHASSFRRTRISPHSQLENRKPQTAKLPPMIGARVFAPRSPPARRSPYVAAAAVSHQTPASVQLASTTILPSVSSGTTCQSSTGCRQLLHCKGASSVLDDAPGTAS